MSLLTQNEHVILNNDVARRYCILLPTLAVSVHGALLIMGCMQKYCSFFVLFHKLSQLKFPNIFPFSLCFMFCIFVEDPQN